MDRTALARIRDAYEAGELVGTTAQTDVIRLLLDALLSEDAPVAMHWPDGSVVHATGSGEIVGLQSGGAPPMEPSVYARDAEATGPMRWPDGPPVRAMGSGAIAAGLHWETLDQVRKAAMRELILERYCVPLENWSA